MNSNKIIFSLLVLGALFFSGCLDLTYTLNINEDGSGTVTQTIDVTKLVAASKAMATGMGDNASTGMDESLQQACANFTKADSCKTEGNKIITTNQINAGPDTYSFESGTSFPYKEYVLVIDYIPSISADEATASAGTPLGEGSFISGLFSGEKTRISEAPEDEINSMKEAEDTGMAIGLKMNVELPGEVYYVSTGWIKDGKAEINLIDAMSKQEAVTVKSRSLDLTSVAIAVGVGVVVLILIIYFLKRKKKAPEVSPADAGFTQPSPPQSVEGEA